MPFIERVASALVGTPLQQPCERLRWAAGLPGRLRHPELGEIYREGERIRALIGATVRDGMNCIDVGAHLGTVLQQLLRCSPSGRHVAVEPLAYKADWLRRKFPGVDVREAALGEDTGRTSFYYMPGKSAFSALRPGVRSANVQLTVPCARLDDIIPSERRIGFLKVDVEGAEYGVFKGASRTLERSRPVILFECTQDGLSTFDYAAGQVYSLLCDRFGYAIYLLKDWLSGGQPLSESRFSQSMAYPFQAFNYVAAHQPPGAAEVRCPSI
jgi:FkbM family methyltransferase